MYYLYYPNTDQWVTDFTMRPDGIDFVLSDTPYQIAILSIDNIMRMLKVFDFDYNIPPSDFWVVMDRGGLPSHIGSWNLMDWEFLTIV